MPTLSEQWFKKLRERLPELPGDCVHVSINLTVGEPVKVYYERFAEEELMNATLDTIPADAEVENLYDEDGPDGEAETST